MLWRGCRDEDDSYGCWTVLGFQRGVGGCDVTEGAGAAVTLRASLRGKEITDMTVKVDAALPMMYAQRRAVNESRTDGPAVCHDQLGIYIV